MIPDTNSTTQEAVQVYAWWYWHFYVMQPKKDHFTVQWAHDMAKASLSEFWYRPDWSEIQRLGRQKVNHGIVPAEFLPKNEIPQKPVTPKPATTDPPTGQLKMF